MAENGRIVDALFGVCGGGGGGGAIFRDDTSSW